MDDYVNERYYSDAERQERDRLRKQKIALTDRFLVLNQTDLPDDKIPILRDRLLHCSMRKLTAMQNMTCRRAHNMQFISLILGWTGIDRMLLGEVGIGLLKLVTFGGFGFIMLYDWLTVGGRTRKYNYIRIMSVMDYDDYEG